jgi:hypothetical protein
MLNKFWCFFYRDVLGGKHLNRDDLSEFHCLFITPLLLQSYKSVILSEVTEQVTGRNQYFKYDTESINQRLPVAVLFKSKRACQPPSAKQKQL